MVQNSSNWYNLIYNDRVNVKGYEISDGVIRIENEQDEARNEGCIENLIFFDIDEDAEKVSVVDHSS